jgi:hypothetical protein
MASAPYILTSFFSLGCLASLVAMRPWARTIEKMALTSRERCLLTLSYRVLAALLCLTAAASTALWGEDPPLWHPGSSSLPLLLIVALVLLDMTGLGLVLTAAGMSATRTGNSFTRAAMIVECAIVCPMAILVVWALLTVLGVRAGL